MVATGYMTNEEATGRILFHVCGIVLLTTLINGTTAGLLYKWLKVYPPNPHRAAPYGPRQRRRRARQGLPPLYRCRD